MYHVEKEVLKFLTHPILLLTRMPPSISLLPLFKTLCISFKDKKAYIKRCTCFFLIKSAIVAYSKEVGALP